MNIETGPDFSSGVRRATEPTHLLSGAKRAGWKKQEPSLECKDYLLGSLDGHG